MKTSVATTFAMIAPTKNPSSRLKIVSHTVQRCLRLNGRCTIEAAPHAGHCSFSARHRTRRIVRGSRFITFYREQRFFHLVILRPVNFTSAGLRVALGEGVCWFGGESQS